MQDPLDRMRKGRIRKDESWSEDDDDDEIKPLRDCVRSPRPNVDDQYGGHSTYKNHDNDILRYCQACHRMCACESVDPLDVKKLRERFSSFTPRVDEPAESHSRPGKRRVEGHILPGPSNVKRVKKSQKYAPTTVSASRGFGEYGYYDDQYEEEPSHSAVRKRFSPTVSRVRDGIAQHRGIQLSGKVSASTVMREKMASNSHNALSSSTRTMDSRHIQSKSSRAAQSSPGRVFPSELKRADLVNAFEDIVLKSRGVLQPHHIDGNMFIHLSEKRKGPVYDYLSDPDSLLQFARREKRQREMSGKSLEVFEMPIRFSE